MLWHGASAVAGLRDVVGPLRPVRELSASCPRDPRISTDLNESLEMTGRVARKSRVLAPYTFPLRGKGFWSVGATGIEPVTSAV